MYFAESKQKAVQHLVYNSIPLYYISMLPHKKK